MPINWPPATAPIWPPPELTTTGFSCSDWVVLIQELKSFGFTQAAPTGPEQSAFFNSARCDDNHSVIGRMLVNPSGVIRYPFCVCNNGAHREMLVLWPPFTCGTLTGPVSF